MTQQKKFSLLFILFICNLALSQDKLPLRQYLEQLESKFDYTFSFRDDALLNHNIRPLAATSFNEAISYLEQNTLFNYAILKDKTVAIRQQLELITICGNFKDQSNLREMSEAVISTPYQENVLFDGPNFSLLTKSSTDIIAINIVGYQEKLVTASELIATPCADVLFDPLIEYLNTVTLTNYFAKGISKNTNGSLTVDYDDFDILPGLIEPDVLLTIQALPGVQSVDETVSFLNIRGGTNDQNLILWDGIKMYQNGHFFGLISAFNPFLTKQVDVIKNGTTAALGDGVSGVISMEGEQTLNTALKAEVGLNLISTDAFVDVPIGKKASVQIAGRKSINNVLETPTYKSYFDKAFQNTEITTQGGNILPTSNDDFSFVDGSVRLLFKPSQKETIRANFLVLANELEFVENAMIDGAFQSLKSDLVQNNVSAGLFYQRKWSPRVVSDIQLYGSAYTLQAANQDIVNNQRLFQENKVLENGARITTDYKFSEKVIGKFGYQFNETGITNFVQINNPFFSQNDKQVILTQSAFVETQFSPSSNTKLSTGLRLNHINKFDTFLLEPRLSFSHQFLEHFSFELLGELKSQTTSQVVDLQNDFLGVENRRWVLSKPDEIPIVQSRQLSAGISFSQKGWLVSAEPYLKKVTGITSQSQGFQNQFINEKTSGSYTAQGIDFLLNKRFKKINTWLSYSYAENKYNFTDFTPQKFHNNIDIRHNFTYGVNYSLQRFNISVGCNYHSGKPVTPLIQNLEIVDSSLNFDLPNSDNIDDYIRVDVSGTYQFNLGKKSKGFIGVSIWNLLNTENVVNQYFTINSDQELEKIKDFSLRFTPNASFRVSI